MQKSNNASSDSILIVAAETSSTLYAQRLLEFWRKNGVNYKAFGIGSREMEKLGFDIVGRSEELAVVGLQEVVAHWSVIKAAFHGLLREADIRKPQVALLLDYPDFNLRLAKKLKAKGIKVVYYVSPQVWAWRQGRVKTIQKLVDRLLLLFPFEVDFYKKHAVSCEFVGHPLLDEIPTESFDPQHLALRRSRYGVREGDLILALMPGSRRSELKHHLLTQLQTASILVRRFPNLKVQLLVSPNFEKEDLQSLFPPLDFPITLVKDEPFAMIQMADVVLCASGTATLMVGLMEKPMVIMYKMNPLTAWVAKKFVKHTAHFGMINLVLGERVCTELFQEAASPEGLANELGSLLDSKEARDRMAARMREAKTRLGERGATERVARAVSSIQGHADGPSLA